MNARLQVGDWLRCPHCRKWHSVVKWHSSGTDYTLKMLYFRHNGQMFYAGQEGLESPYETKAAMQERVRLREPGMFWRSSSERLLLCANERRP